MNTNHPLPASMKFMIMSIFVVFYYSTPFILNKNDICYY